MEEVRGGQGFGHEAVNLSREASEINGDARKIEDLAKSSMLRAVSDGAVGVGRRSSSRDSGYCAMSSPLLDGVKIGLKPEQYEAFVKKALELHEGDYLSSLGDAEKGRFGALPRDQQLDEVFVWMTDPGRMEANEKPRLEMRQCFGGSGLCANVALCCRDGAARGEMAGQIRQSGVAEGLHFVEAGSTTLEVSSEGVDKATPINYLRHEDNFNSSLEAIGYKPGATIDARLSQTLIVSDADGTIWDKPETGKPVEASNLFNSEARGPILSYLKQGGVLVLNTGNDPARTVRRFVAGLVGLSQNEKNEILSRVLFSSAGGGSMAGFINGELQELPGYHEFDPKTQPDPNSLDLLYLGDDAKMVGNDMPGFIASGDHFICVAPKKSEGEVKKSQIGHRVQYGEVNSTHAIFTAVVIQAMTNKAALGEGPQPHLFTDMEALLANTRNIHPATEITKSTLQKLGGREMLNQVVSRDIDAANPSLRVLSKDVVASMAALPRPSAGEPMTYSNVMRRIVSLSENASGPVTSEVSVDSKKAAGSVSTFLDETNFVERSKQEVVVLRILEPGNNDQSTPMFVAYQIKALLKEVEDRGGNPKHVRIEVLVMGKGGHATTAVFPQIGQMSQGIGGQIFSGTEEAISLGGTLERALKQSGVAASFVKHFGGDSQGVAIKLEKTSTNTGQNVANARESFHESRPDFQWVVAATPSSRRQLLTFAHQYEEGGEKLYDELWGMPMPRSEEFVRNALSDYQVTTEFYAGMAEKARLVNYAMGDQPFIPPFTTDQKEFQATLDTLFETYAKLEGVDVVEAKKSLSIGDLQKYYADQFAVLEQAIPWSKAQENQEAHVQGAMRTLQSKAKTSEVRQALSILGDFDKLGIGDEALKTSVENLARFLKNKGQDKSQGNLLALSRRVNECFINAS